jgi:hypothetical protein
VSNIFPRNKQTIENTKREIIAGVRFKPRERFGVRSETRILWTKEVLRIFGLERNRPFLGSCTDEAPIGNTGFGFVCLKLGIVD